MQTSNQVKQEVMFNIISRMVSNGKFDQEQIQELKSALNIEMYKINMSKESTEVSIYDNSYNAVLNKFLIAKRIEGRAETTLHRYKGDLSNLLEFFAKPVSNITTDDLRYYLSWYKENRNISLSTLNGMRLVFRSFFSWCFEEGIVNPNPALKLHTIKSEQKIKEVISDESMEYLRCVCRNPRDYAVLEFLYATGARVSEVERLNRDDIDFKNYKITVLGKGNKQRIIHMNARAAVRLKIYLDQREDDNPALFVSNRKPNIRLSSYGIRQMLKRLQKKADVTQNIHPHAFRTKFATDMAKHGAPIDHIALLLGHSKIDTTRIYAITSKAMLSSTYDMYQV